MLVASYSMSTLAAFTSIGSLCRDFKEHVVSNVAAHRLGTRVDLVLDGANDSLCRHLGRGTEISAIESLQVKLVTSRSLQTTCKMMKVSITA